MAVYGPGRLDAALLVAWLDIADAHGWPVATKAQHIVPIVGATGWLQYVSKHAARALELALQLNPRRIDAYVLRAAVYQATGASLATRSRSCR